MVLIVSIDPHEELFQEGLPGCLSGLWSLVLDRLKVSCNKVWFCCNRFHMVPVHRDIIAKYLTWKWFYKGFEVTPFRVNRRQTRLISIFWQQV